jgi:hypothetical protein
MFLVRQNHPRAADGWVGYRPGGRASSLNHVPRGGTRRPSTLDFRAFPRQGSITNCAITPAAGDPITTSCSRAGHPARRRERVERNAAPTLEHPTARRPDLQRSRESHARREGVSSRDHRHRGGPNPSSGGRAYRAGSFHDGSESRGLKAAEMTNGARLEAERRMSISKRDQRAPPPPVPSL